MSVKVDQFLGRIKFAEEANETKIELGDLSSQSRYFYSIRRGAGVRFTSRNNIRRSVLRTGKQRDRHKFMGNFI